MKTLIVSFFTFFIVTAFATETNIYDWKSDKFTLQLELNIGSCYNLDRILWQYEGITKTIPKVFEASPLFERLNHVQISIWREYFNQDSLSGKFEFKGNDTLEITLFGEPLLHEIIKFLNFIEFNETITDQTTLELNYSEFKLNDIFNNSIYDWVYPSLTLDTIGEYKVVYKHDLLYITTSNNYMVV